MNFSIFIHKKIRNLQTNCLDSDLKEQIRDELLDIKDKVNENFENMFTYERLRKKNEKLKQDKKDIKKEMQQYKHCLRVLKKSINGKNDIF